MKSKWITIKDEVKPNLYVRFKKSFTLDKFENVIIDISADDYYKLYVNGFFAGQGPAPSYSFEYAYNQLDITELLSSGENEIEVLVYYQGLVNRVWVSGDNRLGLVADVYVDNALSFGTDTSWKYSIVNSFVGKKTVGYDTAFLEDRDFTRADSEPQSAIICDNEYTMAGVPFPSLEVYSKRVEPVINGSRYFYDFKEEYAGVLRVSASGERLVIRYGEELENGRVKYDMRCGCCYEEHIILNGDVTFEGYDYKGFRYVEIEAHNAEIIDCELLIQHYPFPTTTWDIETDNADLRAAFDLCKSTIKYGTQESFIDCPTREKGQYIGDAFISGFAHFYLTNDPRPLKRAIESFANSLHYGENMLAVSNCAYQQEIADYSLLFPIMVLKYYNLTQDTTLLSHTLPACNFIVNYFAKFENENGLLENATEQWNLVDWPENLRDEYEFSAIHNVINAFYYACVNSTEKIKEILEIDYSPKAEKIKEAYNDCFLKNGLYVDNADTNHSAVHSNMLPLAFDISRDKKIADYLIKKGLQCGTYMSYFYLKALANAGYTDEVINTITNKTDHGWLNMLKEGATRTFEAWGKTQKWNTSLFHPWSTTPIAILYEQSTKEAD